MIGPASATATSISGTVTNAGGIALQGVFVFAIDENGSSATSGTYTDASGHYDVTGLAPESYGTPGGVEAYTLQFVYPGGGYDAFLSLPIAVSSGDAIAGVDVTLVGTSISGTVTNNSGIPLSGIEVVALDASSAPTTPAVLTDSAGRYSVAIAAGAGNYKLEFSDPNNLYIPRRTPLLTVNVGDALIGVDATLVPVDVSPPNISLTSPVDGAQYTVGDAVNASYSCTAAASTPVMGPTGIGGSVPTTITSCAGPVADGTPFDTSTVGTHTFTVDALDSGGHTASQSLTYFIHAPEIGPPTISLITPSAGAQYTVGQVVHASYTCDDAAGRPLVSCTASAMPVIMGVTGAISPVSVSNGAPLDTSTAGATTFTAQAIDQSSLMAFAYATYTVHAGDAAQPVSPGDVVTTDPGGLGATPQVPVQTEIAVPPGVSGQLTVTPQPTGTPPTGFGFLGQQVVLTGPAASVAAPYVATFAIDTSALIDPDTGIPTTPAGVQVFRNGEPVADCTDPTQAVPDPCVEARGFVTGVAGDVFVRVRTTQFSTWNVGRRLIPPLGISTASLPNGVVGVGYSSALVATGGVSPVSWSVVSGALPSGLTLNPSSGAINGTPTVPGTALFSARTTDTNLPVAQSATTTFSITVAPTANPAIAKVGVPYWSNVASFNGVAPYHWSRIDGAVPAGLTLNPTTGAISGTPSAEGKFAFTVQVVDSKKPRATKVNKGLKIAVAPVAINIAPSTLASAVKGVKYSAALSGSGGIPGYTFKVAAGAPPTGLVLGSSGVLTGKPTTRGTYNFAVTATDKFGFTGTRDYSITVT